MSTRKLSSSRRTLNAGPRTPDFDDQWFRDNSLEALTLIKKFYRKAEVIVSHVDSLLKDLSAITGHLRFLQDKFGYDNEIQQGKQEWIYNTSGETPHCRHCHRRHCYHRHHHHQVELRRIHHLLYLCSRKKRLRFY